MTRKFKMKWLGIMLIVIGIAIPIISLAFTSNYHPKRGLIGNIQKMYVVINKGTKIVEPYSYETIYMGRVTIDYKYLFAIGIILTIFGIGLRAYAAQSTESESENYSDSQPPPESPKPPESSEPPKEPPFSGGSSQIPNPWVRFWARSLDIMKKTLIILGVVFVSSIILSVVIVVLKEGVGIRLGFFPAFILFFIVFWPTFLIIDNIIKKKK